MIRQSISSLILSLAIVIALLSAPFVSDVSAQATQLRKSRTVSGVLAEGDTVRVDAHDGRIVFQKAVKKSVIE